MFYSPRNSPNNAAGLRLLQELTKSEDLIVVLMQDAVLQALDGLSGSYFQNISSGYVLDEHLAKRGFTRESLQSPFRVVNYDEFTELVMNDETHVVGSF